MDLEAVLTHLSRELAVLNTDRVPSRFVAAGANPNLVEQLAAGTARPLPDTGHRAVGGGIGSWMGKALAEGTGSAGGYLVPTEIADEVLRLLRARSAVMRMGVSIVPVHKELAITSLLTGATAAYVGENERIAVSQQTFGHDPLLRPKALAALVPVSNRLLRDADNPSADLIIRTDIAEVLALRADHAFLSGTGPDPEPVGILNTAGLTPGPDLGADGRTPTFDDLKDIPAALRQLNAPFHTPGWIFNPRLLSTLEKVKDTTGRYLADAGLLTFNPTGSGGTLLGYPFATTTQIPTDVTVGDSDDTTSILFSSDWQEAWIGENATLRIEVSHEAAYTTDNGTTWHSAFQQDQTLFRAITTHDIGLRRPELFTVADGVRP